MAHGPTRHALTAPEKPIVGFYIHQMCGDVAFWCTDWPKVGAPFSEYDRLLNGGAMVLPGFETAVAVCRHCSHTVTLKLKYFRAIPRERDLRPAATPQRRAMKLDAALVD